MRMGAFVGHEVEWDTGSGAEMNGASRDGSDWYCFLFIGSFEI